jgi:hypothetical protein
MTYFKDLSDYAFLSTGLGRKSARLLWLGHDAPDTALLRHAETRNIGWLGPGHKYPTCVLADEILETLWQHCKVSVVQTRGFHRCEFCLGREFHRAKRRSEELTLGSAEIRVFSTSGIIYAAPNLIYHYASVHHYCPPDEFLTALREGLCPPEPAYFDRLTEIGLEWRIASVGEPRR